MLAFVRSALADASHSVFVAMCAVAVLTLVAAAVMPRRIAARLPAAAHPEEPPSPGRSTA